MGVDAAALEVRELGVVLQRAHVQPSLLAQLRHAGAVVVRELPLAEDGVGDVGEGDEIDLEHLGLQPRLLRVIVLEHVQEEGRRLSDHVALEEEIGDGVEIQRRGILLPDLDGDVHRALRVVHQRRLQQVAVVGLVPGHLAVLAHLLKLALARERRHNLGVGARLDVHAKRHVRIDVLEHIAERLRALELILRHPRVQQLLLVLLKHETRELHRLGRVELAPLEADAEVLQQRGVLPGLRGDGAELSDGLVGAQNPFGRVRGELGGALVVPCVEEHVELGHDERLGAREVTPLGHAQRELDVVELSGDKRTTAGSLRFIRSTWPRRLMA